tara:strand:- start:6289 stop:7170 length:882 start_codon:yes stop_codon:yes gene_type:complete
MSDKKIDLATNILKIRFFEEKLLDLFSEGELQGTTHTCIGQEATAVGVVSNLNKQEDFIFSNHRNHGHYLAFKDDYIGLMSEIMGKEGGVSNGKGGSQHIHSENFVSFGIQGGILPIAGGVGWAKKLEKKKSIVTIFIGDGTLGQGAFYETLNIISILKIPIFIVIENNGIAQTNAIENHLSGTISGRISAFSVEFEEMTSTNVFDINLKTAEIISKIKHDLIPRVLIVNNQRLGPHSKSDDYRDISEIEKLDPIKILESELKLEYEKIMEASKRYIEDVYYEVSKRKYIKEY